MSRLEFLFRYVIKSQSFKSFAERLSSKYFQYANRIRISKIDD